MRIYPAFPPSAKLLIPQWNYLGFELARRPRGRQRGAGDGALSSPRAWLGGSFGTFFWGRGAHAVRRGGLVTGRRGAWAELGLATITLALTACAPATYAGIPLRAGTSDSELQSLARRARAGDGEAQLRLGIRFEEGRGVARDLRRARALYLDAATRPSKRRTALYLPRKGGGGSVKLFPGDLKFSGNEEALLRWQRLRADPDRAGRPLAASPAEASLAEGRPSTAQATPAGSNPEEYGDAAYRELVAVNGYQPLFNDLKDESLPWRRAILGEPGTRFATPRTIQDTFLYILDRSSKAEPGAKADSAAIRSFCAEMLQGASADSGQRRIAGLCSLQDCRSTASPGWSAAVRSLATPVRAGGSPAERKQEFSDAAFLFRVAGGCRRPADAASLQTRLTEDSSHFERLLDQVTGQGAGREAESGIWRARIGGDMHILLAIAESDLVSPRLAQAAARTWLTSGLPVPPPPGETDRSVAQLCQMAGVSPDICRVQFPHSFFLEQHYFQAAASAVAASGSSDICPAIRMFRSRFSSEIDFRFSTFRQGRESLRFAPRCFPLG